MKPLPFKEALEWARKQKVALPAEYYGLLQGRARAAAFSISGMAVLDQIELVKNSLIKAEEQGWSLAKWKRAVADGEVPLDLPAHRIETIFRTNIQGWYAAGRCKSHQENKWLRPYLMYSAINDSRTRPAHAAMDGYIAPVDDPIWRTWTAPCGFNCRCTNISLTEEEAQEFGFKPFPGTSPDQGWDYSVCHDGPEEGVKRGIDGRKGRCGGGGLSADPAEYVSAQLAAREPWWCRHPELQNAVNDYQDTLNNWDDRNRLLRDAMGEKTFSRHAKGVEIAALAHDITLEQGVVLRAYTDRKHIFDGLMELYTAMNFLGRSMMHLDEPIPFTADQLYKIGIMVLVMDEALAALKPKPGAYWRGVSLSGMPEPLRQRWTNAHRKGRVVQYNGYTSVTGIEGQQYGGEHQFEMHLESPRDIRPFSVEPKEGEFLLPRGVQLRYLGILNGYRTMREIIEKKNVKSSRNFGSNESWDDFFVRTAIEDGYSRERAIEILHELKETGERWAREREQPISEKQQRWWKNMYERMQAEATAGLTK